MNDTLLPPPAERLAVSVEVIILSVREHDLKVLLARRSAGPFRGRWAIPGAFVRPGESLDDAARRELAARAHVDDVYPAQLYTFGAARRDPRGRVIAVAYLAMVGADAQPTPDPAGEATWHSIFQPPDLAFDHAEVLNHVLHHVRSRLACPPGAIELLPNEFTLSELQAAYEVVLGERLDKRNFRRRILDSDVLVATSRHRARQGQGRPPRLYRYKRSAPLPARARRALP